MKKQLHTHKLRFDFKKYQLLCLLLIPLLSFPYFVSAKEYTLSNGIKFEGTTEEYDIAEKILEEVLLPFDNIYAKAFEKINKKKNYKIFNIKDVVKDAKYVGNAGYDKKNKVFYLDSKNGKSEILLKINHPFVNKTNREKFINDFSKEIRKDIKKELKREPLDFKKIDIKEGTDLHYLTSYYVLVSLLSSYEDVDIFKGMFLKDIRIDLGKVKDKCDDVDRCAHYIIASTEKDLLKINENSVNQYLYDDLLPNDILWPQTNFKTKTIFFKNPKSIIDPAYVYIATDQNLLSSLNDRIEINIQDIRFLSELKTREAGL